MFELSFAFVVSAFIAGFLMFLAPCTLPLVPAYLAFIAGVKPGDTVDSRVHRRIIWNSIFYSLGFSIVFIGFGILTGLASIFVAIVRDVLMPVMGVLIIVFGLQMLHFINLSRFFKTTSVGMPGFLKPGSALSALVIGMAFALGWTPCVGPILATILLLAGTSGTIASGAILLAVFSLGLALPFVLTAILYASASNFITRYAGIARAVELLGGVFLILIGVLILTNNFELTLVYGYRIMEFFGLNSLIDYY